MHRIDTKTAQKDKFGAGKNGFTRGNPQTGTPATDLDDDYFDMLQEELCSVVEASGASLEKARHDQLLTALRALLLSRKNPFSDIKSDGTVKTALENLGLGEAAKRTVGVPETRISATSLSTLTKGNGDVLIGQPDAQMAQTVPANIWGQLPVDGMTGWADASGGDYKSYMLSTKLPSVGTI
ncbi:phage tail protein [Escherichia coli HVH 12 (4-7653042)]|nr:phage tail protein [Escherichia coli HVH 12 (4-7653042)]